MASKRIRWDMSVLDVIKAMGGGNPGALRACMELLSKGKEVDPDAVPDGGLNSLLILDELRIYEERIYMLWNDVCERDVGKMIAVLCAHQLGVVDTNTLNHAIDNRGAGINLDAVVKAVKSRLPNFNPEAGAA